MNRKRVRRISLIVVLFLALGTLWTALQGGPKSREHAAALFQQNRSAFDSAAAQAVERGSGQGISRPPGVQDVTFWDYEGDRGGIFHGRLRDGVLHNILGYPIRALRGAAGLSGLAAGGLDFRRGRLALGGERRGQPLLHSGAGRALVLL